MSKSDGYVHECFIIGRTGMTGVLFSFDGNQITPYLRGYLIAPKEIFTKEEIAEFSRRALAAKPEETAG